MNGAPLPTEYPDQGPTSEEESLHVNIEGEQALLGAVLLNNDVFWDVSGWLKAEHFYEPLHQRIYTVASDLIHSGGLADPLSIRHRFTEDAAMQEVGIDYLGNLAMAAVSMKIASYGKNIVEMATRRNLVAASIKIRDISDDPELDQEALVELAESEIDSVSDDNTGKSSIRSLAECIEDALEAAEEARQSDGTVVGVPSGLGKLDEVLGGFRDGQLIVIAARPGMGKSALAVKAAVAGAELSKDDVGILLISLEMKGRELGERVISMELSDRGVQLPYNKISRGQFTGAEAEAIRDVQAASHNIPLQIEDLGSQTVSQISSICRTVDRSFKSHGRRLGCVIIDYLQIITPDKKDRGQGTTAEIGHISNGLKSLAMRMNIPVIALSQLNRQVEARDDKRPTLSDLKNSGDIEQDAHVVMFLLRKEYYLRKQKPPFGQVAKMADWTADMDVNKNRLMIYVEKNRGGPSADIEVYCDIAVNRIEDEAPEDGQSDFDLNGGVE